MNPASVYVSSPWVHVFKLHYCLHICTAMPCDRKKLYFPWTYCQRTWLHHIPNVNTFLLRRDPIISPRFRSYVVVAVAGLLLALIYPLNRSVSLTIDSCDRVVVHIIASDCKLFLKICQSFRLGEWRWSATTASPAACAYRTDARDCTIWLLTILLGNVHSEVRTHSRLIFDNCFAWK